MSRHRQAIVCLSLMLLFSLAIITPASQSQATEPLPDALMLTARHWPTEQGDLVAGQILVRFHPKFGPTERQEKLALAGVQSQDSGDPWADVEVVQVPAGQEKLWAERLSQDPAILYAEPDYMVYASKIPNDSYYSAYQWNLRKTGLEAAWERTTGSSGVIIAVLDTGADLAHPDLAGKTVSGYDFVNNDSDPQDDEGHGTHVSGIAAAASNNGLGITGVAWGSKIMPVKVLSNTGSGSSSAVAQGIRWAADHGAKIINMSLGGSQKSNAIEEAVNYAYGKGCLIVAAAGNEYLKGNPISYPAALAHVVAVAATGDQDEHARYSNTGSYVDIAAPGGNASSSSDPNYDHWILSTYWRGSGYSYVWVNGTSQACPHVAGLAALLWSLSPALTHDQIENVIERTSVDLGASGKDVTFGWGRINAAAAIAEVAGPRCATYSAIDSPAENAALSGNTTISGWAADFASANGTGISAVEVWLDGQKLGAAAYGQWRQDIAAAWGSRFGSSGYTYQWDTRTASDGNHALELRCQSACGWQASTRRVVSVRNHCQVALHLDWPQPGVTLGGELDLSGWAADPQSASGTGISRISVWLDGAMNQGRLLGEIASFQPRPDIAALLGQRFLNSGYRLRWNSAAVSNGAHTLYVYAQSGCGWSSALTRSFNVQNTQCQVASVLDWPQPGITLGGEFDITGWALDQLSRSGTGIDQVSLWLDGAMNQGIHLGDLTTFQPRPDLEAVLGPSYRNCGYSLRWNSAAVSNGSHTLYIYARSACGWSSPLVHGFTVQNCLAAIALDWPQANSSVKGEIEFSGWAVDQRSQSGTGIDRVSFWLDGAMNQGTYLGEITAFEARPDIAALLGANFRNSGYRLRWNSASVSGGTHMLYVYAHTTLCGWSGPTTRSFGTQQAATPTATATAPLMTPTATRTPTATPAPPTPTDTPRPYPYRRK